MENLINILLSVVAIAIAIYSSKQTSKDATRQIESIKQLSKLQLEIAIKQVEIEIQKNRLLAQQAQEEWKDIQDVNNSRLSHQIEWRNEMLREKKERKPQRDFHLYSLYIKNLDEICSDLTLLKKKLN